MGGRVVRVTSVVEGYGEVAALPLLIRRIAEDHGQYPLVDKPHRINRADFTSDKLKRAYRLQRLRAGVDGVVVLLCDADDADPTELRSHLLGVSTDDGPLVAAVAVREYESWFLAGIASLRGQSGVRSDAVFDGDAEGPRNAKKPLEAAMTESYKETLHQAAFSSQVDLQEVRGKSPSFALLHQDLGQALHRASGI